MVAQAPVSHSTRVADTTLGAVLAAVLSDKNLSHSELRLYIVLALNAVDGWVTGLTCAILAEQAALSRQDLAAATRGLAARGYITCEQPRKYKPNRYCVIAMVPDDRRSNQLNLAQGSGAQVRDDGGSPREELRSPVAPPSPPLSHRRAASALYGDGLVPGPAQDQADPMRILGTRKVVRWPAVWHMLKNPPDGFTAYDVYLSYVHLERIAGRQPGENDTEWPDVIEFLEAGRLDEEGMFEALRDAICSKPRVIEGEPLTELELAILNRRYKGARGDRA